MTLAPIWPVATDALVADTTHLGPDEFGAYVLLMMAQWRGGGRPLPADDTKLARICRVSDRVFRTRFKPLVEEFFEAVPEGWSQKRLRRDYADVAAKIAKNRANGHRGGIATALKNKETGAADGADSAAAKPWRRRGKPDPEPDPRETPSGPPGTGGESPAAAEQGENPKTSRLREIARGMAESDPRLAAFAGDLRVREIRPDGTWVATVPTRVIRDIVAARAEALGAALGISGVTIVQEGRRKSGIDPPSRGTTPRG